MLYFGRAADHNLLHESRCGNGCIWIDSENGYQNRQKNKIKKIQLKGRNTTSEIFQWWESTFVFQDNVV